MHCLDQVGEADGGIAGEPMETPQVRNANMGGLDQEELSCAGGLLRDLRCVARN
jgi:hypothetical protein